MNSKLLVLASVSALCFSGAVATATVASGPTLSGTYLVTYVETCQATFANDTEGGGINTEDNGRISTTTGTAVFTPKTTGSAAGKVKVKGFQTQGTLIIVSNVTGAGTPMATSPFSLSANYSTTTSAFTLNGNKFQAAFSPSSGAVTSVVFSGIDSENAGCAVTGTLQQVTQLD
jgi:hypothetical protein